MKLDVQVLTEEMPVRENRECQGRLGEPSHHGEGLISAGERGEERELGRKSLRFPLSVVVLRDFQQGKWGVFKAHFTEMCLP